MGWQQLADMYREAAATLAAEERARLTACPNDGDPLAMGPDDLLFCPRGDWNERDHHC